MSSNNSDTKRVFNSLMERFHKICVAKKYPCLKIFHALTGSSSPPPPEQTFYLRATRDHSVFASSREDFGLKAFSPWDRYQLWCFIPVSEGSTRGMLFNVGCSSFLTADVSNKRLIFVHGYGTYNLDYNDHVFEYSPTGWIHVKSQCSLKYCVGCSMHPSKGTSMENLVEIIPAHIVVACLRLNDIHWSSTNNSEALTCDTTTLVINESIL